MKSGLFLILLVLSAAASTAQVTPVPTPVPSPTVSPLPQFPGASPLPSAAATPVPSITPVPVARPYSDSEFSDWVLKTRRAEIITVGVFPLAFIFAGMGYDIAYYFGNGMPQSNMPWPAGPGTSQWPSTNPQLAQQKNITLVAVSLGIGMIVAGLDYWLGLEEK